MAIDLVLRKDWNARPPRGDYTQLDSTKGVKVHYTGGRVDPGIVSDHSGCVALVRSIQGFHMDDNGWIDIGYCVDEETELLTRQGWKSYRDLRAGDVALTLDHDTGMSEWQPVLEVCVFPAMEREMIRMEGPAHSSLTTPHHRWPVERQAGQDTRRLWVTTETIGHRDRIPVAAPCADLPAEPKWSDAFVELVAWFAAEGASGASGVAIHRSRRDPAHLMRIRAALHKVFGPPAAGASRWRETARDDLVEFRLPAEAGRQLAEVAPGRVPGYEFLLSLSRAQLALFLETSLTAGDAGRDRLAREDRAAAEAYMFAALLAGSGAAMSRLPETGMWLTTIRRQHSVVPRPALRIRRETYRGRIWCPRTENQSWLARREGTVYFTGNTMVACPHRKVFEGRGPHHLPAANGPGLNAGHYAVLGLVGNAGLVQPTDGVLHAILDAIQYLRDKGRAGTEIKGHRDGYSTDCPGDPLYDWIRRGAPGRAGPRPRSRPRRRSPGGC